MDLPVSALMACASSCWVMSCPSPRSSPSASRSDRTFSPSVIAISNIHISNCNVNGVGAARALQRCRVPGALVRIDDGLFVGEFGDVRFLAEKSCQKPDSAARHRQDQQPAD